MSDYDIGTGQTYTTIGAWLTAENGSFTEDVIGRCLDEQFNENVLISGGTNNGYYLRFMGKENSRHDGRPRDYSGSGAAILYQGADQVITVVQGNVETSWLDIRGPGNNNYEGYFIQSMADGGYQLVHHCIIHNNSQSSASAQRGMLANDNITECIIHIYRNVIYGHGAPGIFAAFGANGSAILLNTLVNNHISEFPSLGGLYVTDSQYIAENNAIFNNRLEDIASLQGAHDNNATSDDTGDFAAGLTNLVTANQFTDTDAYFPDLTLISGSDLINAANTTYSTDTYPEINIGIRGNEPIDDNWDIGADEFFVTQIINYTQKILDLPVVGFKTEDPPYTDINLATEDYHYNINQDLDLDINIATINNRVNHGDYSRNQNISGQRKAIVNFSADMHTLVGENPNYFDLLGACGITGNNCNRQPATIECAYFQEGSDRYQIVYKIHGSMGTVKITGIVGKPCKMEFSFLGGLQSITTKTGSSIIVPADLDDAVPESLLSANALINDEDIYITNFEIMCGNIVNLFSNISTASGYDGSRVVDRIAVGNVTVSPTVDNVEKIYNHIKNNEENTFLLTNGDLYIQLEGVQFNSINQNVFEFTVNRNITIAAQG